MQLCARRLSAATPMCFSSTPATSLAWPCRSMAAPCSPRCGLLNMLSSPLFLCRQLPDPFCCKGAGFSMKQIIRPRDSFSALCCFIFQTVLCHCTGTYACIHGASLCCIWLHTMSLGLVKLGLLPGVLRPCFCACRSRTSA